MDAPARNEVAARDPARQRRRWALAAGCAETWRRFRADWRETPALARRRFLLALLVGWLLCAALSIALALGGRALASGGMDAWDLALLQDLLARSPMSFQAAIWFEGWGSSAMLIPVTLVAVVVAARAGRALQAIAIAAAFVLHDFLVMIIHWIWPRVRPDIVADGLASPPLNAFPSGHTVQVIAVYGLLAWLWAQRSGSHVERVFIAVCLAVLTATVAYARLRLGTHWPSDVLAAVPLGLAWLLACIVALEVARRTAAGAGRTPG